MADLHVGGLCLSEFLHSDFSDLCRFDNNNAIRLNVNSDNNNDSPHKFHLMIHSCSMEKILNNIGAELTVFNVTRHPISSP
ncbi:hypothetical protein GIB67_041542 [Kingdonia uniflora]|uniref:Uncharacterized protein n=1 Tax=Kingdonia uniflora TaxID=39325 RepID=A0A7J7MQC3_9MAGN|nr:hypothetical protein GIB67_041542 [Kingdonia uniflora]